MFGKPVQVLMYFINAKSTNSGQYDLSRQFLLEALASLESTPRKDRMKIHGAVYINTQQF